MPTIQMIEYAVGLAMDHGASGPAAVLGLPNSSRAALERAVSYTHLTLPTNREV